MKMIPSKSCDSCGREIEYRKKWARDWDNVKFCSDECRRNKNKFDFRDAILNALSQRPRGSSICPSDVLPLEQKNNPDMLEHVRRSSRLLATANLVDIIQNGKTVEPSAFRGPIRLRLKY